MRPGPAPQPMGRRVGPEIGGAGSGQAGPGREAYGPGRAGPQLWINVIGKEFICWVRHISRLGMSRAEILGISHYNLLLQTPSKNVWLGICDWN